MYIVTPFVHTLHRNCLEVHVQVGSEDGIFGDIEVHSPLLVDPALRRVIEALWS